MKTFFLWNLSAMLVGFLLDLLAGDPAGWPHPVVWLGKYISWMEKKLRARGGNLRLSAVLLTGSTALLAMSVTGVALLLLSLLGKIPLFIGMCLISWTTLSARCLAKESKGVADALKVSTGRGRKQVGRIVGRDTNGLSEQEIICATVETVAENTNDGVIAPIMYLLLGGPVLAMGFKAVSTLDSMVGYLNEKYRDIGWSSARLDDALNYIPARVCAVLMCLSAGLCGLDAKNALLHYAARPCQPFKSQLRLERSCDGGRATYSAGGHPSLFWQADGKAGHRRRPGGLLSARIS